MPGLIPQPQLDENGNPIQPELPAAPGMPPAAPAPAAAPITEPTPDDPRLLAALDQQNKQRKMADLLKGFQQILQGGAAGSGFKADMSMADEMNKRADEPVTRYKEKVAQEGAARKEGREIEQHKAQMDDFQVKLAKSKLDFTDMTANRDPSSPQSKLAQDRVIELRTKQGLPTNEQSVRSQSGESLFKIMPELQKDLTEYFQNQRNDKNLAAASSEKKLDRASAKELNDADNAISLEKERLSVEKDKNKENRDVSKEDRKEQTQIQKENRKMRAEMDKAESAAAEQIKSINAAKKAFESYSKGSLTGGTGPVSTLGGLTKYVSSGTEGLDSTFKGLSFDELTKKFQGMSKAIDSDGERRAFESTQPSVSLDDNTNKMLLDKKLAAAQSLLTKVQAAKAKYDREGKFVDSDPTDDKIKQPNTGLVKMLDPNGVPRMVPADQVEAAKAAGGKEI